MKKLKTMVPWHVQRCTSSLTILQAMWSAETRVQVSQCSIFSHACFLWHITEVLAWTIMFPFAVTQLVITTFPLWMTSNGRKVSVCQHSLQDAEGSLWHMCFKVNLFFRGSCHTDYNAAKNVCWRQLWLAECQCFGKDDNAWSLKRGKASCRTACSLSLCHNRSCTCLGL